MAVIILKRTGLDDADQVARWTPNEGFVEGDLPLVSDPVYDDYSTEQMLAEFDGPTLFAVETDDDAQMTLADYGDDGGDRPWA